MFSRVLISCIDWNSSYIRKQYFFNFHIFFLIDFYHGFKHVIFSYLNEINGLTRIIEKIGCLLYNSIRI